ncbi:MAG: hypothetical protein JWN08_264 [Frankiales bacterium]|nr:hypothetical protein [Frankiales bacterium]
MTGPLTVAIAALAVALALAGGVLAARDLRPGKPLLQGVLALQLLVLVQAAIAVVRLLGGDAPDETGAFVGYLVVSVLLVPAGMVWSFEEKSRYGTLVLAVVCLVVAVLQERLGTLWSTVG